MEFSEWSFRKDTYLSLYRYHYKFKELHVDKRTEFINTTVIKSKNSYLADFNRTLPMHRIYTGMNAAAESLATDIKEKRSN